MMRVNAPQCHSIKRNEPVDVEARCHVDAFVFVRFVGSQVVWHAFLISVTFERERCSQIKICPKKFSTNLTIAQTHALPKCSNANTSTKNVQIDFQNQDRQKVDFLIARGWQTQ